MGTSVNQDIKAGDTVYHIQTEYYESSGKIVTNIFKDGAAVKRLEKELEDEASIDEQVRRFHESVVERLKRAQKGEKKVISKQSEGFRVSDEDFEKLLVLLSPVFGITSAMVIEGAAESSSSREEFIEHILSEIPSEEREAFRDKLEFAVGDGTEKFDISPLESSILSILSEYFGIVAAMTFEDALSRWESEGDGSFESFVRFVVEELEDESKRAELEKKLLQLKG